MYTPVYNRCCLALTWLALLAYGVLALAASGTMATSGLLPYYVAGQLATEGHFELLYTEEVLNKRVDELPDRRHFPGTPAFDHPSAHAYLYAPISYLSYRNATRLVTVLNILLFVILVCKLSVWFGLAPGKHRVVTFS
jgi:hypothetical protein